MKTVHFLKGAAISVLFSVTLIINAQETPVAPQITDQQREQIRQNIQKMKQMREEFKASLTQEQKDMLTDPRMMPADRERAFRKSLTDNQVKMLREKQQEMKMMRTRLETRLSDAERLRFRRMMIYNNFNNREVFRRARMRYWSRRI
jgi:hypothetical protein